MGEKINPFLKRVKESAFDIMEDCTQESENCLLFVAVSDEQSATGMAGNIDDLSDALAAAMLEKEDLVHLLSLASVKFLELKMEERLEKLKQTQDLSKQN
jgi:hypothetical protein